MSKGIPRYIRNLEALGVDVKKLRNSENARFYKRKELALRVGEEELDVLEVIGRTLREGRWKEKISSKALEKEIKRLRYRFGTNLPREVQEFLENPKDNLMLHYIKRKYIDGWNIKSPSELDLMFTRTLKGRYSKILKQVGGRLIVASEEHLAVVEAPNKRITLFSWKAKYASYEEWYKEIEVRILKTWDMEELLKKLQSF